MKFAYTDYGSRREIIKVVTAFITFSGSKEIVLHVHVIESISDIDEGS
mgnify:CR=1 FL=1